MEWTIQNHKTLKGQKKGYLTAILHLAPANVSGTNVCPKATAGCKASCLNTAGMGHFDHVQAARIRRTREYLTNRGPYYSKLTRQLLALEKRAKRQNLTLVVRPNGTSDLPRLAESLATLFPRIQFYDYTKIPRPWERITPNYHLTFSRSENNWLECVDALNHGINVAVVFDTKKDQPLPKTYAGRRVFDGDQTDLRFLDPKGGVIIGLRAKGRAKKDQTGFVVRTGDAQCSSGL